MRAENSGESTSLAPGGGRLHDRRKPAAGSPPALCLHFSPTEINFGRAEVANAAALADAPHGEGGKWWRSAALRSPHSTESPQSPRSPRSPRAGPRRPEYLQFACVPLAAAAGDEAEAGRDAVTMPRPPAAPGAPEEGAAALLRRREAFSKGHSVSLDSADGLVTAACADAAPSAAAQLPAGRAAAHESGSLSDSEEAAADSSVFSRLRLKVRQSPPPPAVSQCNKTPQRPQSPKAKARRVDRLREFTERLRHTDLKWGRDERGRLDEPPGPAPTAGCGGAHPCVRREAAQPAAAATPPESPPAAAASDRRERGRGGAGATKDAALQDCQRAHPVQTALLRETNRVARPMRTFRERRVHPV